MGVWGVGEGVRGGSNTACAAHVAGAIMATRRAPGTTLLMLDDKKVRGRADWGAMFAHPSTPTHLPSCPGHTPVQTECAKTCGHTALFRTHPRFGAPSMPAFLRLPAPLLAPSVIQPHHVM